MLDWQGVDLLHFSGSTCLQKDIALPREQPWKLYRNSFSVRSKKTRVCLAAIQQLKRNAPAFRAALLDGRR